MSKPKAITNKGIMIFKDYELIFNLLSDEEVGKVIKLLLANFENGKLKNQENFENEKIHNVYAYIANRINDYLEKSAKASQDGSLGGNPKLNPTHKGTLNPTLKGEVNLKEGNIKEEKEKENNNDINNNFSNFSSSASKANFLYDPDVRNFFKLYEELGSNLIPLGFEKRNLDFCKQIFDFLEEVEHNSDYVREVIEKANALFKIYDNRIDAKAVIKNHARIASGYYISDNIGSNQEKLDNSQSILEKYQTLNSSTFSDALRDFLEAVNINSPFEYQTRLKEAFSSFDEELIDFNGLFNALAERITNAGKGERTLLTVKEFSKIIASCYDWTRQDYLNVVLNCRIQETPTSPPQSYSLQRKDLKGLTLEEYKHKMEARVHKFEWV